MFDMGFTEMVLIGIVALIVIGPERLPGVARTAGKYIGRLKRFMTSVKHDVEQELRADELREILSQQQKELDKLKHNIEDAGRELGRQADATEAEIAAGLDDSPTSPREKTAPEPTVKSAATPAPEADGNTPADDGGSAAAVADSGSDEEAPAARAKS